MPRHKHRTIIMGTVEMDHRHFIEFWCTCGQTWAVSRDYFPESARIYVRNKRAKAASERSPVEAGQR